MLLQELQQGDRGWKFNQVIPGPEEHSFFFDEGLRDGRHYPVELRRQLDLSTGGIILVSEDLDGVSIADVVDDRPWPFLEAHILADSAEVEYSACCALLPIGGVPSANAVVKFIRRHYGKPKDCEPLSLDADDAQLRSEIKNFILKMQENSDEFWSKLPPQRQSRGRANRLYRNFTHNGFLAAEFTSAFLSVTKDQVRRTGYERLSQLILLKPVERQIVLSEDDFALKPVFDANKADREQALNENIRRLIFDYVRDTNSDKEYLDFIESLYMDYADFCINREPIEQSTQQKKGRVRDVIEKYVKLRWLNRATLSLVPEYLYNGSRVFLIQCSGKSNELLSDSERAASSFVGTHLGKPILQELIDGAVWDTNNPLYEVDRIVARLRHLVCNYYDEKKNDSIFLVPFDLGKDRLPYEATLKHIEGVIDNCSCLVLVDFAGILLGPNKKKTEGSGVLRGELEMMDEPGTVPQAAGSATWAEELLKECEIRWGDRAANILVFIFQAQPNPSLGSVQTLGNPLPSSFGRELKQVPIDLHWRERFLLKLDITE